MGTGKPGRSKPALRSDEDGALPQGQEELYLLHLEAGGTGLVPPGPSRCPAPLLPPSVACSEPCDLCSPYNPRLRGTCPCVASVRDCLSSPGHPPRAQGTSPEPRRQAKEPGHHSWGWGFPGCESGVLWHQPCEPAMWPSPSPPSSFIQTSLGTSLPVFSTSLQGARIISLG